MSGNTAARTKIVTAEQLMNLETYGFLDVKITAPRDDDALLCSTDRDGTLDGECLSCTQAQAEELANYLRRIGWAGTR